MGGVEFVAGLRCAYYLASRPDSPNLGAAKLIARSLYEIADEELTTGQIPEELRSFRTGGHPDFVLSVARLTPRRLVDAIEAAEQAGTHVASRSVASEAARLQQPRNFDVLEVLFLERDPTQSSLVATRADIADAFLFTVEFTLSFIPLIAGGIALYEAGVGRTPLTDRKLALWERAVSGLGGVIEMTGPVAVGVRLARNTRYASYARTLARSDLRLDPRLQHVSASAISLLNPDDLIALKELARQLRRGPLAAAEALTARQILAKMQAISLVGDELLRLRLARVQRGVHNFPSPDDIRGTSVRHENLRNEKRAADLLVRRGVAQQVIKIPETALLDDIASRLPNADAMSRSERNRVAQNLSRRIGVADLLVDHMVGQPLLGDVITMRPQTQAKRVENAITQIRAHHRKANVIVVVSDHARYTAQEMQDIARRYWPKDSHAKRIIFVDLNRGQVLHDFARPGSFDLDDLLRQMRVIARSATGVVGFPYAEAPRE